MAQAPSALLEQLQHLKSTFGDDAAARKLLLLRQLDSARLPRASQLLELHDSLLFLRAYPDDSDVLAVVEGMLERFAKRGDLRRHREELADSGVAGTYTNYRFYWFTAQWLARRWPDRLSIQWPQFERADKLVDTLHLLLPYCETPALDEVSLSPRQWIRRLKGPGETDAAFVIRRFAALRSDHFGREKAYEDLDIPMRLAPGDDTPSRTREKIPVPRVVFQQKPLQRRRPASLRKEIERPPLAVRTVPPREARKYVDLARGAMVNRSRDLDVFVHADENDVRLVDCGEGLQFVGFGAVPERRLMFEAVYGYMTLKNGVAAGYVLTSSLFNSTAVALNVFDAFRGGETALVLGRVLAMARRLFGADAFSIDPYQLGHGNQEGLLSGAWWFYYKLGFRPRDPGVRRLVRQELARMKKDPSHRSSLATLTQLSSEHMYFYLDQPRPDVLGSLALGEIGLRISRNLARDFGADREKALRVLSAEAAALVGLRSLTGFTPGERLAWQRWSPVIMSLEGAQKWSRQERRALIRIVKAKGGRREADFVWLFDRHRRLRRAVLELAAG